MESSMRRLLLALLLLAGACLAVLTLDHGGRPRPASASFQRLVGGLGFGPWSDLGPCAFGLDPRLDGACAAAMGPLPGGACFCGRHDAPAAPPGGRRVVLP